MYTLLSETQWHMGIDMVLQSATKYIGGHSDVVAGGTDRHPPDDEEDLRQWIAEYGQWNYAL